MPTIALWNIVELVACTPCCHPLLTIARLCRAPALPQNNYHNVRLEWIVIWLIVVEVIVGLFELLG